MMGRSHLVGSVAFSTIAIAGATWLERTDRSHLPARIPWSAEVESGLRQGATWFLTHVMPPGIDMVTLVWFVPIAIALMLFGSVLADADHDKSLVGRRLHIPVIHRGLTHTDWVLLGFGALVFVDPTHVSSWFWLGLASHAFLDELSSAGRVHFYPFTRHKVITTPDGNQVVVKQNWKGLYKTGRPSEYVVLTLFCVLSAWVAWSVWGV